MTSWGICLICLLQGVYIVSGVLKVDSDDYYYERLKGTPAAHGTPSASPASNSSFTMFSPSSSSSSFSDSASSSDSAGYATAPSRSLQAGLMSLALDDEDSMATDATSSSIPPRAASVYLGKQSAVAEVGYLDPESQTETKS